MRSKEDKTGPAKKDWANRINRRFPARNLPDMSERAELLKTKENQSTHVGSRWPSASYWWIDAVGGFLTFTKPKVTIGQAGSDRADVQIMADLSAKHAEICRGESGPYLVAHADTTVNGKKGTGFLLKDHDRIQMRKVELLFHQPVSWSQTSRLELASRHRFPITLDGIVLLGETCLIGSREDAHIPAPWSESIFLNWYQGTYWVRCQETVQIDGKDYPGWGPMKPTSTVKTSQGCFRFEPIEKPATEPTWREAQ